MATLILTERLSPEGASRSKVYELKTELGYSPRVLDIHGGLIIDQSGEKERRFSGGWSVHQKIGDDGRSGNLDAAAIIHVTEDGVPKTLGLYQVDMSRLF